MPHAFIPADWSIVIPVKSTMRGKSRLELPPPIRRELARAMALDTVEAAAGTGCEVLVVLEEPADGAVMRAIDGVRTHLTRCVGLNEAITDGVAALGTARERLAALPADLPALRPAELTEALGLAAMTDRAVVADRQGSGTTLLAAACDAGLRPQYGPGSLCRHRAAGARVLGLPADSGLRRDVDTVADLRAVGSVAGRRTVRVLAAAGLDLPAVRP